MKLSPINFNNKEWILLIIFFISISIAFSIMFIFIFNSGNLMGAAILITLALCIPSILFILSRQLKIIESLIQEKAYEIRTDQYIYSQIRTKIPLQIGDWAADSNFLSVIIKEILENRPQTIVECGSGTSTLVSAYCLQIVGDGMIISIDHSAEYAQKTSNLLEYEQLADRSEIMHAPLIEQKIHGKIFNWYDPDFISRLKGQEINLLIIDGPPGDGQEHARYPAIPMLKEYLAKDYKILIDDANRKDEKYIASKWAEQLNAKLVYKKECKGYFILTPIY